MVSCIPTRPLVLAFLIALAGCGSDEANGKPQGPPPPSVEVMQVTQQPFVETRDGVGELRAVEAVEIQSEIDGVIDTIEFEEGQAVEAGKVLIRLRDDEQRARLHEAQARVHLAKDEFERTQRLANQNAAAQAQLERRRAELAMANAQLELAGVELARTRIRAPFAGHLGPRAVGISPGARIEPDHTLIRLERIDPIDLVTTSPEYTLPLLRIGRKFDFRVQAYPDKTFNATLSFIAPSVDRTIRRVPIKARVANPDALLRPGMFADIRVELDRRDSILLPEEAVMNDQNGSFVWRLGPENVIERAEVEVGAREGRQVEIRGGLTAGERVVSAGTHKVRAGEIVMTTSPPGVEAESADPAATAARPDAGGGA